MATNDLTAQFVRELFTYDPATGHLLWARVLGRRTKIGHVAGGIDMPSGYWRIKISDRSYSAHRLVWIYHHGRLPVGMLDHINRSRSDNRIENLREVSAAANAQNRRKQSNLTDSGRIGVAWHPYSKRWRAIITHLGKVIYVGQFVRMEDAIAARIKAEHDYGFTTY